MNQGGKNAKSSAELKRNGTFRKDRHGDRVAVPILESIPDAPQSFDNAHKKEWQKVCKRLAKDGLLTDQDLGAVELMVKLTVLVDGIHADLLTEGVMIETKTTKKPNPKAQLYLQFNAQLMSMYSQFGQTPRSRMTVKVATKNEAEDPAAFLFEN